MWSGLNRGLFKRSSTFFLGIAAASFFFERTFDHTATIIFESINKGKLWKDIRCKYEEPSE